MAKRKNIAPINSIGLICHRGKQMVLAVAPEIISFFEKSGKKIMLEPDVAEDFDRGDLGLPLSELISQSDVLMTLGGDGTILHLARSIYPATIPVMGFNLGRVGFLSEFKVTDLQPALESLLSGKVQVSERSMLLVEVQKKEFPEILFSSTALNEVYITRRPPGQMCFVEVCYEGNLVQNYRADGVIISTPTGSTAHAMSAGGPILHSGSDCIAIVPNCPFSLTDRPVVVDDEGKLSVVSSEKGQDLVIVVDGQLERKLEQDEIIVIKKAPKKFHLISSPDRTFFDILREKFSWGS